jgi:prepilin-type N-terminal cleavage/methylation domain-containing protein
MPKRQGFTLIEVLVASLLIMLGVTGYVSLQSEYVLTDAKLNLRSRAIQLAEQKLADLGYFQQLTASPNHISYQAITNNLGGSIASGEKLIQLSTEQNLHSYHLTWQVDDFYFVDSNFDGQPDKWVKHNQPLYPQILPPLPHLKSINVSVSWINIQGQSKQISMLGSIAPIAISQSFQTKYLTVSAQATP